MGRFEVVAPDSLRVLSSHVQRMQQEITNLRRRMSAYLNELDDAGAGPNSVATTTDIIPARSDNTPGGPISVQRKRILDTSSTAPAFTDYGDPVNIWSWVKTDSSDPAGESDGKLWIFIEQDESGVWWFTGQDCPPPTT